MNLSHETSRGVLLMVAAAVVVIVSASGAPTFRLLATGSGGRFREDFLYSRQVLPPSSKAS